ncbi:DegT/DnrJ/EryC1/StrS family aminotransferase [Cryomorphaceae bacterium 1068]|nr:DegT/DnrJ/EryC1/StrS family aminotransferase [Cryomorphaceae bacterium 1068]
MRIPVTKPFLPSKERYKEIVDQIWDSQWLTNNGVFLQRFEKELELFLGSSHTSVVTSGTMALQLALKTLEPGGEIITSPFSYVATTSAIVWEGFTPIFADVEADSLCIDPSEVEKKITSKTKAILATHVYGNPCKIDELERISSVYGIQLFFDGAHAFGTKYNDKSVLEYGDISVLSFHATKLFHTVNGGAVFCKSATGKEKIDRFRNFGHVGVNEFDGVGINGKMCEFHSAMGLLNLEVADGLIAKRREQWHFYRKGIEGSELGTISLSDEGGYNGAYFPVIFSNYSKLQKAIDLATEKGIELRRYFNPSLNKLDYVDYQSCPISEDISERICCLPQYHDLTNKEQSEVLELILSI